MSEPGGAPQEGGAARDSASSTRDSAPSTVRSVAREDWGAIRALRTFYDDETEIEFGIGTPDWAGVSPADPDTLEVVRDGMLIVFERHRLLRILVMEAAR